MAGCGVMASTEVPGPGAHDLPSFPESAPVSHVPTSASYSMGGKLPEQHGRPLKTGPGQYHARAHLTENREPKWSFNHAQRRVVDAKVTPREKPGPGPELAQRDNQNFNRAATFRFGSAKRDEERRQRRVRSPGPGEHNPRDITSSKCERAPSFSVTSRRNDPALKTKNDPGPGSYDQDAKEPNKTCKFNAAARLVVPEAEPRRKTPGPGHYTSLASRTGDSSVNGSAPKWSMAGRPKLDFRRLLV